MEDARITHVQGVQGGEFDNVSIRDWSREQGVLLSYSPAQQPQSNGPVELTVGLCKTVVRRLLYAANCQTNGGAIQTNLHSTNQEKNTRRAWGCPVFGDYEGVWRGLEPQGAIGQLFDIGLWHSEATKVLVDGVVVQDPNPRKLDPLR